MGYEYLAGAVYQDGNGDGTFGWGVFSRVRLFADLQQYVPVHPTGISYEIRVTNATIQNLQMAVNDQIGVFDDELCVGVGTVDGNWPMSILTWQSVDGLPGFTPGNRMTFRLMDISEPADYFAGFEMTVGDTTFGFGNFTRLSLFDILPAVASIEPNTYNLDFGEVPMGTTRAMELTILNNGTLGLNIRFMELSGDDEFSADIWVGNIDPQEEIPITVYFNPEATGNYFGQLSIASNDPNESMSVINLSGIGSLVIPPELGLSDTDLDFGVVESGSVDTLHVVIGNNAENSLLILDGIELDGAAFGGTIRGRDIVGGGDVDTLHIAGGGADTLWVTYAPEVCDQLDEGMITIHSNDPVYPVVTVELYGSSEPCGVTQHIDLQGMYFELISFQIIPPSLDAEDVFGRIENLAIVYSDDGSLYMPGLLNTIGDLDLTEGYKLFCYDNSEWEGLGNPIAFDTEYCVTGGRWNWIGHPYLEPFPSADAFGPLDEHTAIIQSDDGRLYLPPFLDTIINLYPNEGYFFFPNDNVCWSYPEAVLMAGRQDNKVRNLPEVEGAPTPTGLPYLVKVNCTDELLAQNPVTVEVYDGNLLAGKAVKSDDLDFIPVIAWGGDQELGLEGFTIGDEIRVVIRDENGRKIAVTSVSDQDQRFGTGPFADLTLDIRALPKDFTVGAAYPNPFNPTVTVPFSLPDDGEVTISVFNVVGQTVFHSTVDYQAGEHSFIFDTRATGINLVSGLYFLRVQYHEQMKFQKLMLLK